MIGPMIGPKIGPVIFRVSPAPDRSMMIGCRNVPSSAAPAPASTRGC
jgi:hypothetical protein